MNKEWTEKNKKMQNLLKKDTYQEGIEELLKLRNILMEEILSWKEYPIEYFYQMPFINANGYHSKSIAYSLWHIFRIEDIVVNSLIKREEEILFTGLFKDKMNSSIITTGNELVGEEIEVFSRELNIDALYQYIESVKQATDNWLKSLNYVDLKTKYNDTDKTYLRALKVVSSDESADWLVDYWCDKDVKGLIKMPLSRHWIMHIEASIRILEKLK